MVIDHCDNTFLVLLCDSVVLTRKIESLYTCLLLSHFVCTENYELLFPFFDPVVHLPPECLVWFPVHPPVQQGSAWTVAEKADKWNKQNTKKRILCFILHVFQPRLLNRHQLSTTPIYVTVTEISFGEHKCMLSLRYFTFFLHLLSVLSSNSLLRLFSSRISSRVFTFQVSFSSPISFQSLLPAHIYTCITFNAFQ